MANFDGTTWTHYLQNLCILDMDIAPDGSVWLQAGEVGIVRGTLEVGPIGTYVIPTEAPIAE